MPVKSATAAASKCRDAEYRSFAGAFRRLDRPLSATTSAEMSLWSATDVPLKVWVPENSCPCQIGPGLLKSPIYRLTIRVIPGFHKASGRRKLCFSTGPSNFGTCCAYATMLRHWAHSLNWLCGNEMKEHTHWVLLFLYLLGSCRLRRQRLHRMKTLPRRRHPILF